LDKAQIENQRSLRNTTQLRIWCLEKQPDHEEKSLNNVQFTVLRKTGRLLHLKNTPPLKMINFKENDFSFLENPGM
jgi:hypothetical protein